MISAEENELLCRVEGDAPMGKLIRRFWMPVCLIEEVSEPDGAPVHARVCGKDLVVFRDTKGSVGVLDEKCPHRRASLLYGRNEDCGLRCIYHGWKMDVEGNIVDIETIPSSKRMMETTKHIAYPTKEWGGFIWAYLGSVDTLPEFTPPQWAPVSDARVSISKVLLNCNWAQILEGNIDSSHSSSLHISDMIPTDSVNSADADDDKWYRPSADKAPRMTTERTSYGFRYCAIRKPIKNADSHEYIRSSVFIAPTTVLIPPNSKYNVAHICTPMDDTNTVFYLIAWGHDSKTPDTQTWRKFNGAQLGVDLDERFRPLRNHDNRFWQDRDLMKTESYTGISGFSNQDFAMFISMGAIANRPKEKLAFSDLAIIEFRKCMIDAVKDFVSGNEPIGTGVGKVDKSVCSFQAIVPKGTDWRDYKAKYVWNDKDAEKLTNTA